jgi:hypothetical protein
VLELGRLGSHPTLRLFADILARAVYRQDAGEPHAGCVRSYIAFFKIAICPA